MGNGPGAEPMRMDLPVCTLLGGLNGSSKSKINRGCVRQLRDSIIKMKTTENTGLISAGIGFETAEIPLSKGNKVIIIGRNDDRLKKAPETNRFGIHVGRTADLNRLSLASPADALLEMNP